MISKSVVSWDVLSTKHKLSISRDVPVDSSKLLHVEHSLGATGPARAYIPLAMVAHEVRNLLTPVVAQCEMALARTGEERSRKALELTVRSVNDVVHAMQSVLDASADGAARVAEVDIHELLDTAKALMASEWPAAEIQLSVPRGTKMNGDGVGFRIAICNLTRNALESGATRVIISAMGMADTLAVKVEDNGPGLPTDLIEGGFRPFRRSTSGGTGLGLFIASTLIAANGGDIQLEASSGNGTCWCIRLQPFGGRKTQAA